VQGMSKGCKGNGARVCAMTTSCHLLRASTVPHRCCRNNSSGVQLLAHAAVLSKLCTKKEKKIIVAFYYKQLACRQ
jgi:hypothetical protein